MATKRRKEVKSSSSQNIHNKIDHLKITLDSLRLPLLNIQTTLENLENEIIDLKRRFHLIEHVMDPHQSQTHEYLHEGSYLTKEEFERFREHANQILEVVKSKVKDLESQKPRYP